MYRWRVFCFVCRVVGSLFFDGNLSEGVIGVCEICCSFDDFEWGIFFRMVVCYLIIGMIV